ncbi:hypothetical protein B5P41_35225, partial [Bacillus sp. SRB_28]
SECKRSPESTANQVILDPDPLPPSEQLPNALDTTLEQTDDDLISENASISQSDATFSSQDLLSSSHASLTESDPEEGANSLREEPI